MTSELRDRLIEELGINILFTDRTKTGIRFCWGRHTEISQAIDLARSISDAGNWPVDLPNFIEALIVEVFISKSAWYKYKSHFSLVKKHYPDMIDWLNQELTGEEEDKDVWGDYRSKYTLEDLKEFLDLGGRLKKTRKQSRHSSDEEDNTPTKGKGKSHKKKYNN
jgi:ribulose kinase